MIGSQPPLATDATLPTYSPILKDGMQVLPSHEMLLLRILCLCDEAGCPRYFYDKLMLLLSHEHLHNKFDLSKAHPKRDTLLHHVAKVCGTATRPVEVPVRLDNDLLASQNPNDHWLIKRNVVKVIYFDFESQLKSLLRTILFSAI